MNYREEIGSELQTLRVQKGLTVRELAEASGVHYSNIAKIENGKYNVSVDILGKVADALGYKLAFEPKKTYSLDPYGKTVGEFRRHLAGSGTEFVEIGRTLISCNDPAEHPYDVARIEEMHIDSMRPHVIELIVTMR
jgi:transcriptional regulator with XRE-family HTH domain